MDANGVCLPSDLLLDVLRRLPGRSLAVSRCVCRAWRDLIDAHTHTLLLPQVFPREFPGVFATYYGFGYKCPTWIRLHILSKHNTTTSPTITYLIHNIRHNSNSFDPNFALDAHVPGYRRLFWNHWDCRVKQHCNVLLLVTGDYRYNPSLNAIVVCNPATSRYARLPQPPTPWPYSVEGVFLAFDPAVSPHHHSEEEEAWQHKWSRAKRPCWVDWEHTSLPNLFEEEPPSGSEEEEEQHESHAQEPPRSESHFRVLFTNRRVGTREFTPGRCALGHLYDVVTAPRCKDQRTWWSAEYRHGSLYVHCHSGVLMVLHCSKGTYDMVELPGHPLGREGLNQWPLPERYLGSYGGGIRYAVFKELQLEVWDLTELADGQLIWTLAHKADLKEQERAMNYTGDRLRMELKKTWAVVESTKDLISLFERENDEDSNDDCADGTEEDTYEEGEEVDNYNETRDDEEEKQDRYDETRGEEDEEQDNYGNDDHAGLESSDDENFWGWGRGIVGFHPYKDVLLLKFGKAVVAYHLHNSRIQYLGDIYPRQYHQPNARDVHGAFPYRPCYVDALPPRKTSRSS
ncbi:hypothetical protein VPH35_080282 [Triticum aestivum]